MKSGKETLPKQSLTKALKGYVTWTTDSDHRLLTFLCRFPGHFIALTDAFIAKAHNKQPVLEHGYIKPDAACLAIQKHGTPVRLLKLFYEQLDVRLVLYQGPDCRYVHTPSDWEERPWHEKDTVVLNIWSKHVFTYDAAVNKVNNFNAKPYKAHPERKLVSLDEAEQKYDFSSMHHSPGMT